MKFIASVVTFFLATVAVGPLGSVCVQGFAPMSSSSAAAVKSSRSQSQRAPAFLLRASEASSENTNANTSTTVTRSSDSSSSDNTNPLGLTPELLKLTLAFESIGDDKLRYKQLLYMANQLQPMDEQYQTPANKVPGCLSTVYIHAVLDKDKSGTASKSPVVNYIGDSDGLLTKGLVALLVRGFSGNTAEQIQHVDPAFVKQAGIDASLTPGRNNGFLNMLAVMKRKAAELAALEALAEGAQSSQSPAETESVSASSTDSSADVATSDTSAPSSSSERPMYDAIVAALQTALEPVKLTVVDNSDKYDTVETHFSVEIVSDNFDKLNVIKRQKLVYSSLGDVMPNIEALQIQAFTPAEVQAKEE